MSNNQRKLYLLRKEILFDESPVLVSTKPDENWQKDWKIMAGDWKYEDGYLIGIEPGERGGIIFSRECFNKPVMLTCKMSTVLPATRDVNCVFCAHWNDEIDNLGLSYVCGLNGWYEDKCGIERNDGSVCLGTNYKYVPGTEIEMTVGAIDGHCFMFVDGNLVCEFVDDRPDYIRDGHVGISPWSTILKVRDLEVREIVWQPRKQAYEPQFDYKEIMKTFHKEKFLKE